MSIAINIKNISHTFPPHTVLTKLNFSINKGQIFGLLGPNGGGKTTLFRILSTLLKPSNGDAEIFGESVLTRAVYVRNQIGVVFQSPSLDPQLTVKENLICQGNLNGISGQELLTRIEKLLEQFSLENRLNDKVKQLSGGLKRRVEIVKGMIHNPKILIMDEPSTGLDPKARRDLWSYLKRVQQNGMTILLTTHLMEEAEQCDQLALLHKGHLVIMGTPIELKGKIGGDVISVAADHPTDLLKKIEEKFGDKGQVIDNVIHIEKENGHSYIPQLSESFPGMIQSISVGKPTLEDVFIHMTGEDFWHQSMNNGNSK